MASVLDGDALSAEQVRRIRVILARASTCLAIEWDRATARRLSTRDLFERLGLTIAG